MPASYEILPAQRLVRSRAWGVFSDEDFRGHPARLVADPAFDPSYHQLVDLREVTELRLSSAAVSEIARASVFAPGVRRAFIASTDFHYGMARMFGLYAEDSGQEVEVFRDLAAAEAWLGR